MKQQINFSIVQSESDFWALKAEWKDLFQKSSNPNLFLSWEWISTWWRYYGIGKKPFVILVGENGNYSAIVPFYLKKQNFLKMQANVLSIMGDEEVCSEYLDMLCISGKEQHISNFILSILFENICSWDLMILKDLSGESELLRSIKNYCSTQKLKMISRESTINPYFVISQTWAEYFDRFGKKTKKNFRWGLNKISKDAETHFVRFPEGSTVTCDAAMDEMMRLHEACWRERGRHGVFKRKRFRDFHKDIAERFLATGQLALFFLYRDGKPVAAEYGFALADKFYSYQAGYDPAYKRFGIGNVMQFLTLQHFFEHNFKEFDFLRGELAYKDKFADQKRHNVRLMLSSGNFRGNAAFNYMIKSRSLKRFIKKITPTGLWSELRRYKEKKTMRG